MPSTSIFSLNGTLNIDPGNTRSDKHTFSFINSSAYEICDLNITGWDDDLVLVGGFSPCIQPDDVDASVVSGCTISLFELEEVTLSNGNKTVRIKPKSETILTSDSRDWQRTNHTKESDVTRIVFSEGKCIKPGQAFSINLFFDEELNGNEGIIVAPSRKIKDQHYTFGGSEAQTTEPFTGKDLLELLGSLSGALPSGLFGNLQRSGGNRRNELVASRTKNKNIETFLAINASLNDEFRETSISGLRRLPLEAIRNISKEKLYLLKELGMVNITDVMEDDDFCKIHYLYTLSRRGIG